MENHLTIREIKQSDIDLKSIVCEPFANNLAPNKTLNKCGFEMQKKYVTTPGKINFEQKVIRWKLKRPS